MSVARVSISSLFRPVSAVAFSVVLAGLAGCSEAPPADPSASAGGAALAASHGSAPAAGGVGGEVFAGVVAETMNSGGYTYVRLTSDDREVWVAANEAPVKPGESLTVVLDMPMTGFHSNTLDRDFDLIYFVSAFAREGQGVMAPPATKAVEPMPPPEGGVSVADVWTQRKSLTGRPITVRGTVVKVNTGIMGRNWFHLQDGSGSAEAGTHDLTVTTDAVVEVGQVVTVTGMLATDKDFGAGYSYAVILENATVK
jgi:hypothetical protein